MYYNISQMTTYNCTFEHKSEIFFFFHQFKGVDNRVHTFIRAKNKRIHIFSSNSTILHEQNDKGYFNTNAVTKLLI